MITDVPGVRVGQFTDRERLTGCTVVLCPAESVGSGEVRGGAPGTRETDLLRPGMLVTHVNAFLLTGGSAFGLAAADGVVRYLEEQGEGFETGVARVPIVPAAVLFDLFLGDPSARPDPDAGYAACLAAGKDFDEGNAGAGTGATVAKIDGVSRAVKGGIGTASVADGESIVGAIFAVNAYGRILDERGAELAGPIPGPEEEEGVEPPWPGTNTTIGVVAANAVLDREGAFGLAGAGHDGISKAVEPAHTIWDGDTVFSLATGETEVPQALIREMAEEASAQAIRRAIRSAEGVPGAPAAGEARTE
ncbi:MAG: P1 family peptidase [Actinomycetota bacterium]